MASAQDCLKIAPALADIFNQSLKSSVFPKIWKEGKVTPIYTSLVIALICLTTDP